MKRVFAAVLALGLCAAGIRGINAQGFQAPAAPAADPIHKSTDSLLRSFTWRSIGPANMGGRIVALSVLESDPCTW